MKIKGSERFLSARRRRRAAASLRRWLWCSDPQKFQHIDQKINLASENKSSKFRQNSKEITKLEQNP
jgi:hypothetical protein